MQQLKVLHLRSDFPCKFSLMCREICDGISSLRNLDELSIVGVAEDLNEDRFNSVLESLPNNLKSLCIFRVAVFGITQATRLAKVRIRNNRF